MAKGMFAVTACLLALACGSADASEEGTRGPRVPSGDDHRPLPSRAGGEDNGDDQPGLPYGWTNVSCPGPACDPEEDQMRRVTDPAPDLDQNLLTNPAPGTMPSALPPDLRNAGRQTR
jgi:hypothetical protein